jgi:hypothetical protein
MMAEDDCRRWDSRRRKQWRITENDDKNMDKDDEGPPYMVDDSRLGQMVADDGLGRVVTNNWQGKARWWVDLATTITKSSGPSTPYSGWG